MNQYCSPFQFFNILYCGDMRHAVQAVQRKLLQMYLPNKGSLGEQSGLEVQEEVRAGAGKDHPIIGMVFGQVIDMVINLINPGDTPVLSRR